MPKFLGTQEVWRVETLGERGGHQEWWQPRPLFLPFLSAKRLNSCSQAASAVTPAPVPVHAHHGALQGALSYSVKINNKVDKTGAYNLQERKIQPYICTLIDTLVCT